MKKILLTGSNGMLGGKLTSHLLNTTDCEIIAVTFTEDMVREMIEREEITQRERVHFLSNDELLDDKTALDNVYGAVHLAFARRVFPAKDIASSIDFAAAVFRKLAQGGVERVINLSSQGVYGKTEEFRTESTPPAPETQYTMAKYAAEVLFDNYMKNSAVKDYTNLRLDLVVQSQNLIPSLCRQAKEGKISLRGGEQRFSFIDADDAVRAIAAMLFSGADWESVYNVGWNRRRYTLTEAAEAVAAVSEQLGYGKPEISLDTQDISLWAGMDSSRFTVHTGWKPEITFEQMIERIFKTL